MERQVLGGKYKILDNLHSDNTQNIYLAEDITRYNVGHFVINEIKDNAFINGLRNAFQAPEITLPDNFVEVFTVNDCFYVAAKHCEGISFEDFLSNNNLRLSDKMYIAESLLSKLCKMDNLSNLLKFLFCSEESLSIASRKNICFNVNFKLNAEALSISDRDIINRTGNILCEIFSNTPGATLENNRDSIPPSMLNLIKKCSDGSYNNFSQIYSDFKSLLLYSTFIDNSSIDKQIMKSYKKAKRKQSFGITKIAVPVLLALILAVGFWWFKGFGLFNKEAVPSSGSNYEEQQNDRNSKPAAKFTSSISKVYVGNKVTFTSKASDADMGDEISEYDWTVAKNNGLKELFSNEQNASYTFEEAGDYIISLTVKDKKGLESDAYSVKIIVYPQQDIPPSEGSSILEEDAK